jgi:hypothetical protein
VRSALRRQPSSRAFVGTLRGVRERPAKCGLSRVSAFGRPNRRKSPAAPQIFHFRETAAGDLVRSRLPGEGSSVRPRARLIRQNLVRTEWALAETLSVVILGRRCDSISESVVMNLAFSRAKPGKSPPQAQSLLLKMRDEGVVKFDIHSRIGAAVPEREQPSAGARNVCCWPIAPFRCLAAIKSLWEQSRPEGGGGAHCPV